VNFVDELGIDDCYTLGFKEQLLSRHGQSCGYLNGVLFTINKSVKFDDGNVYHCGEETL